MRAAITLQREDDNPNYEAFYGWAWLLYDVTQRLGGLCHTLAYQVEQPSDRRILRDDERGDPAERLGETRALLIRLARDLARAEGTARDVHSSVSHLSMEIDAT